MPRLLAILGVLGLIGLPMWLIDQMQPSEPPAEITGEVRDEHGPVSNAVVQIKGTTIATTTDEHGRFRLPQTSAATFPRIPALSVARRCFPERPH